MGYAAPKTKTWENAVRHCDAAAQSLRALRLRPIRAKHRLDAHPAITRIATVLSWINAVDIPDDEIKRSVSSAQEYADVRAIIDRVKEFRRTIRDPKANHWITAREEFIHRALAEAGVVLTNDAGVKS